MLEGSHADFRDGLAIELDRAGDLLEELAVLLCLDPVVFERHPEPLQRFDLLTQTLREVASLLRVRVDTADAITGIRLEGMARRLTARVGPA